LPPDSDLSTGERRRLRDLSEETMKPDQYRDFMVRRGEHIRNYFVQYRDVLEVLPKGEKAEQAIAAIRDKATTKAKREVNGLRPWKSGYNGDQALREKMRQIQREMRD